MKMKYQTSGTCSLEIVLDIENDIIRDVQFVGGCSGNTQGICRLVTGMPVDEVIDKVRGIDCKERGTSCPDQLSKALLEYKKKVQSITAGA